MRRAGCRGQSMVEYLAIAVAIILVILAAQGPLNIAANQLMVRTQSEMVRAATDNTATANPLFH